MQLAVDVSLNSVLTLISRMNLEELETLKEKIIEKELYFHTFQKDDLDSIVAEFRENEYSPEFLNDLENGLRMSSVYNEH